MSLDFNVDNYSDEELLDLIGLTTDTATPETIRKATYSQRANSKNQNYFNFFGKVLERLEKWYLIKNYPKEEEMKFWDSSPVIYNPDVDDRKKGVDGGITFETSPSYYSKTKENNRKENVKLHFSRPIMERAKLGVSETYNTEYIQGYLNPLLKTRMKAGLLIDSKSAQLMTRDISECGVNTTTLICKTDFIWNLSTAQKDIVKMRIKKATIDFGNLYIFTPEYGTTSFKIVINKDEHYSKSWWEGGSDGVNWNGENNTTEEEKAPEDKNNHQIWGGGNKRANKRMKANFSQNQPTDPSFATFLIDLSGSASGNFDGKIRNHSSFGRGSKDISEIINDKMREYGFTWRCNWDDGYARYFFCDTYGLDVGYTLEDDKENGTPFFPTGGDPSGLEVGKDKSFTIDDYLKALSKALTNSYHPRNKNINVDPSYNFGLIFYDDTFNYESGGSDDGQRNAHRYPRPTGGKQNINLGTILGFDPWVLNKDGKYITSHLWEAKRAPESIFKKIYISIDDYSKNKPSQYIQSLDSRDKVLDLPSWAHDENGCKYTLLTLSSAKGLTKNQKNMLRSILSQRKFFSMNVYDVTNPPPETLVSCNISTLNTNIFYKDDFDESGSRNYFGPINISRLRCRLFDERGKLLPDDIVWDIELEFEYLYQL